MKIPRWTRHSWVTLLIVLLLVFPKGGFKIGHIPLTWGYLLLSLTALFALLRKKFILPIPHSLALLTQLPFQLLSLFTFYLYGVENIGFAFAFITHFIAFPLLFLGLFSHFIDTIDLNFFLPIFKKGVLFIASFGIFLFFFKIITGKFLLIPLLTSNIHDIDVIDITKCIARGNLFKLISTYNNGNIYGICLLILLPLYQVVEESHWKQALVKFSLILTLSRTIWIGLLVEEVVRQFYVNPLHRRAFFHLLIRWSLGLSLIAILLHRLNFDFSFIWDPSLGGRLHQLSILQEWSWLGNTPFEGFFEITYLSVLKSFGLLGLLCFLLAITSPLWIYLIAKKAYTSTWDRSLLAGLSLYLFISCSDGAALYIPVMAFYWFVGSLLLARREVGILPYLSSKRTISSSPKYSPT